MERARATWTDQRLDDMARRMDDGFNRVDQDIRAFRAETKNEIGMLRAEMSSRFDAADARAEARFDTMGARTDAMGARTDAFQRTMLQLGGGMIVTFVVGFAGILVAQLA